MKRRNDIQIISDILMVLLERGRVKPTHVLYAGNLSYNRLKMYMSKLIEKGMVNEIKEKGKIFYEITEKGIKFNFELKKIREITDAFGL